MIRDECLRVGRRFLHNTGAATVVDGRSFALVAYLTGYLVLCIRGDALATQHAIQTNHFNPFHFRPYMSPWCEGRLLPTAASANDWSRLFLHTGG